MQIPDTIVYILFLDWSDEFFNMYW